MSKKPLSQSATKQKMVVFFHMWAPKDRIFWFHQDRKIVGKRLEDAREFARKHGFDGITIAPPGRNWHE